jgi:hypothetical protein
MAIKSCGMSGLGSGRLVVGLGNGGNFAAVVFAVVVFAVVVFGFAFACAMGFALCAVAFFATGFLVAGFFAVVVFAFAMIISSTFYLSFHTETFYFQFVRYR